MTTPKLHGYQKDAVNWVLANYGAGLFLPPGLGKTLITLSSIDILKKANDIDCVIVIAPLRVVYMVWQQEIEKWGFNLSSVILHGKDKDMALRKTVDIYLTNPESLPWLKDNMKRFIGKNLMIVCDESTVFKNHQSLRFNCIKSIIKYAKRRLILTGTPVPNGLMQLWPQMFIIDNGRRLGVNITRYRSKYFVKDYYGYNYTLIPGADTLIYNQINDIVMHKDSSELDLPELMYNNIYIQLPDSARKVYKEMKNHLITEYEEADLIAFNAAAKAIKLKQIANGNVYDEFGKSINVHREKLNAISELIESLAGRPLLVAYEYLNDLAMLKHEFNAPHIGGGGDRREEAIVVSNWNKGLIPVLLIQPRAGGHGLNLQHGGCHDVVWYSITFDLELYEQLNHRVFRQGVKNSVTIHHVVCKDTVDEEVINALAHKSSVQNALLDSVLK